MKMFYVKTVLLAGVALACGTSMCMLPKKHKRKVQEKILSFNAAIAAAQNSLQVGYKVPAVGDVDDFLLKLPRNNFLTVLPQELRSPIWIELPYRSMRSVCCTSKTLYYLVDIDFREVRNPLYRKEAFSGKYDTYEALKSKPAIGCGPVTRGVCVERNWKNIDGYAKGNRRHDELTLPQG